MSVALKRVGEILLCRCLLLDEETRANAGRSLTLTAATYAIVTSRAVSLLATAYDNCTVLLHELDNMIENEPVVCVDSCGRM